MEKRIDPEEILKTAEPILPKFERLCEKEFNSEMVKSELEKLNKEELIELQVNMFSQYHEMAKLIVDMAEALKVTSNSGQQ